MVELDCRETITPWSNSGESPETRKGRAALFEKVLVSQESLRGGRLNWLSSCPLEGPDGIKVVSVDSSVRIEEPVRRESTRI